MQGQQQMREAVAYSKTPMPDTIDIDGVQRELSPSARALQKSLYSDRTSLFEGDEYVGKRTSSAEDNDVLTDEEAGLVAGRFNTGNGFVEVLTLSP